MEAINSIRKISIWIFITPFVVLNLCLFISINYHLLENTIFVVDQIGRSGFTIPYIDGSLSISRSARTYPTYLLFKPGMIITGILLIQYWFTNNQLYKKISNETNKNKYFLYFGIGSAFFLILHSIFLGINFDIDSLGLLKKIDNFLRRFILLGFIIFEIIAQALLVISLIKIKNIIPQFVNKKILTTKIILVLILIFVALMSAPILNSSEYTHFKHALEWNYFLGIITFYLLTFFFWRKFKPSVHTP